MRLFLGHKFTYIRRYIIITVIDFVSLFDNTNKYLFIIKIYLYVQLRIITFIV